MRGNYKVKNQLAPVSDVVFPHLASVLGYQSSNTYTTPSSQHIIWSSRIFCCWHSWREHTSRRSSADSCSRHFYSCNTGGF